MTSLATFLQRSFNAPYIEMRSIELTPMASWSPIMAVAPPVDYRAILNPGGSMDSTEGSKNVAYICQNPNCRRSFEVGDPPSNASGKKVRCASGSEAKKVHQPPVARKLTARQGALLERPLIPVDLPRSTGSQIHRAYVSAQELSLSPF